MIPRGIRNNNPGNLRHGGSWQGMAPAQTDPDFIQFVSPEYGIRAMAGVLLTYSRKYNLNTVAKIINRWAPPSENDTQTYITSVCTWCSVGPGEVINIYTLMPKLIKAIIQHENGQQPYSDAQINQGIALIGGDVVSTPTTITTTTVPPAPVPPTVVYLPAPVTPAAPAPVVPVPSKWTPNTVSVYAGVGVALAGVLVWAIQTLAHVTIPDNIVSYINILCAAGLTYLHPAARGS
jgi:hypothetical protein